jgi:hypothetical protein
MIPTRSVTPAMPVVGSTGTELGQVDRLEGPATIRLARDRCGRHHYIPLTWVTAVDDKVHLDRTADQAMREWSMTPTHENETERDTEVLADPLHVERVRSQQSEKADTKE